MSDNASDPAKELSMPIIGLRQLSRETADVVEQLQSNGEPVVVTRHGRPVAALITVDDSRIEDLLLSSTPSVIESAREAEGAVAAGTTKSLSEALAEMPGGDQPEPLSAESFMGSGKTEWLTRLSQELAAMPELSPALNAGTELGPDLSGRIHELNQWIIESAVAEAVKNVRAINMRVLGPAAAGSAADRDERLDMLAVAEEVASAMRPNSFYGDAEPVDTESKAEAEQETA
jgi:prevent-host-death family protein